jgi:DNA-binding LacI/PurR family transcriptional regulator
LPAQLYRPSFGEVRSQLLAKIARCSIGDTLPTRDELADELNTSRSTVDSVLRDLAREGWVSTGSGRRRTVLDRSAQRVRTIVVARHTADVERESRDWYFGAVHNGIVAACENAQVAVRFLRRERHGYGEMVAERGVQGLLAIRPYADDLPALMAIDAEQHPVVLLGAHANARLDNVISDNAAGMDRAVDYLVSLGHRDIGFIALLIGHPDFQARYDAFTTAADRYQLAMPYFRVCLDHEAPYSQTSEPRSAYEARVRDWLQSQRNSLPTAIIAADSTSGRIVSRLLRERNVSIPSDVSVVQFDNRGEDEAEAQTTVVQQDPFALGKRAAERLIERTQTPDLPRTSFMVPVEFHIGASSSPPRPR